MNEPKRTFDEKVKAIGGAFAALTGILAVIAQFNETLKKAVDSLEIRTGMGSDARISCDSPVARGPRGLR
jgi:carbamoylphosphate synthase large subunit